MRSFAIATSVLGRMNDNSIYDKLLIKTGPEGPVSILFLLVIAYWNERLPALTPILAR